MPTFLHKLSASLKAVLLPRSVLIVPFFLTVPGVLRGCTCIQHACAPSCISLGWGLPNPYLPLTLLPFPPAGWKQLDSLAAHLRDCTTGPLAGSSDSGRSPVVPSPKAVSLTSKRKPDRVATVLKTYSKRLSVTPGDRIPALSLQATGRPAAHALTHPLCSPITQALSNSCLSTCKVSIPSAFKVPSPEFHVASSSSPCWSYPKNIG